MTEREIDIADMQCWVFRIAQTRWHISPIECAELFKKYDILGYISECYDLLCTYSYYHVVDDAELILASHNVFMNDINSLNKLRLPLFPKKSCFDVSVSLKMTLLVLKRLKSNRTVYHSIFPPSNRWTGFSLSSQTFVLVSQSI